jgi:cytochrome P450
MHPYLAISISGCIWIFISYHFICYVKHLRKLRAFNGPFPIPFFGNLYDTSAFVYLKYLSALRKQFGSIFVYFVFSKPFLVIADAVVVRRILSDAARFPKNDGYCERISIICGKSLLNSAGSAYSADRSRLWKYFSSSSVHTHASLINSLTTEAIHQLLVPNMIQNVESFLSVLTMRVYMNITMGTDLRLDPARERTLCLAVSRACVGIGSVTLLNLPYGRLNPIAARGKAFVSSTWALFRPIYQNRKRLLLEGVSIDDPLGAMVRDGLPEMDVRDHLITLLCMQHDTVTYFAAFTLYLLAQNPSIQSHLRSDIESVMKNRVEITNEDVVRMKYLSMVLQESLRLFPVIPYVMRRSAAEVVVKEENVNITIPADTDIMIPLYLINRDPAIWDKQNDFMPDRFADRADFSWARKGFFPFGYGTRCCLGNFVAVLQVSIYVCHVIRKFTLEPDPKYKPQMELGLSLTCKNGVSINVKKLIV